jgi:hypothetical protein
MLLKLVELCGFEVVVFDFIIAEDFLYPACTVF